MATEPRQAAIEPAKRSPREAALQNAAANSVAAVVRDGTRTFVFVRAGDTFDRREFVLGRADDRFAEVRAGLAAGEPVAVTAADELNTAWASVR